MLLSNRLLLVLPIKAYRASGEVFIERQACNGLTLWLRNFEAVTLACLVEDCAPPIDGFSALSQIDGSNRLEFFGLPDGRSPICFARSLPGACRLLSKLIDRSDYLQFAIWGLWG